MPATPLGWALLTALTITLAYAVRHLWTERHHPHPPEFDDIAVLERQVAGRAALRRTTDTVRSLR
jgi:hypothetical protein